MFGQIVAISPINFDKHYVTLHENNMLCNLVNTMEFIFALSSGNSFIPD